MDIKEYLKENNITDTDRIEKYMELYNNISNATIMERYLLFEIVYHLNYLTIDITCFIILQIILLKDMLIQIILKTLLNIMNCIKKDLKNLWIMWII